MTDVYSVFLSKFEDMVTDTAKARQSIDTTKNTTNDGGVKNSIRSKFYAEYDAWDKKKSRFSFNIGNTSKVLQSLGVRDTTIKWDATKILKIQQDHPAMTDTVIKQVPTILENPVLVMKSKTVDGRLTLFGEVYDKNNSPVLAVLELNPIGKSGKELNLIKVASAYGKDVALQKFIDTSEIVYTDKKRIQNWLNVNRLKLPLRSSNLNSNNSISNSTENVKFSMKETVEQTKDLVAIHNLHENEMLKTLSLGGLPMPSIAIMKAQQADQNSIYGEISLVFGKETIDPALIKSNKVYGGDVWSPVYPAVEYKLDDEIAWEIYHRVREATKNEYAYKLNSVSFEPSNLEKKINSRGVQELISDYKNNYSMKQLYLAQTDVPVQMQTKETRTEMTKEEIEESEFIAKHMSEEIKELGTLKGKDWLNKYKDFLNETRIAYYKSLSPNITEDVIRDVILSNENMLDKINVARRALKYSKGETVKITTENDTAATNRLIDSKINKAEYEKWLYDMFEGLVVKKGIRNNVDPYTSMGNLRSWEALHYEETLENVVKQMKSQNNGDGAFFSAQSIWAVAAKNYGTIEEIRKDSDRLQRMSDEDFSNIKSSFIERFSEIARAVLGDKKIAGNYFIDIDNTYSNILEAVRSNKTKSGILSELRSYYGDNVTSATVDDILDLIADVGNMPTTYFEAKPQRAVGFDEVKGVVIPSSSSQELKSRLNEQGFNVVEYELNNDESRIKALNSIEDVKFSKRAENIDDDPLDGYNIIKVTSKELWRIGDALSQKLRYDTTFPRYESLRIFNTKFKIDERFFIRWLAPLDFEVLARGDERVEELRQLSRQYDERRKTDVSNRENRRSRSGERRSNRDDVNINDNSDDRPNDMLYGRDTEHRQTEGHKDDNSFNKEKPTQYSLRDLKIPELPAHEQLGITRLKDMYSVELSEENERLKALVKIQGQRYRYNGMSKTAIPYGA